MPNTFNNCTAYQTRVAAQLRTLLGTAAVSQPAPDEVLLPGASSVRLPVTSNLTTTGCAAASATLGAAAMAHAAAIIGACFADHAMYLQKVACRVGDQHAVLDWQAAVLDLAAPDRT